VWFRDVGRGIAVALSAGDARRVEKEIEMQNHTTPSKKMYKVLCMLPRKDGGTYWARCGSAFINKDSSINVHLDLLPRGEWKFQLRELDEEDLRKREPYARAVTASPAGPSHANDQPPF
jgi:hypothetical protein